MSQCHALTSDGFQQDRLLQGHLGMPLTKVQVPPDLCLQALERPTLWYVVCALPSISAPGLWTLTLVFPASQDNRVISGAPGN